MAKKPQASDKKTAAHAQSKNISQSESPPTQSIKADRALPYILLVTGGIGSLASLMLTLDKIKLLENPSFEPTCNLNPIISCVSVTTSDQGSVLNFPNPFLGLFGFAIIITIGAAMLAGGKFARWFWLGLQAGVTSGMLFVVWLMYQSFYNLQALCLYCMVTWAIMLPLFWYVTLYNIRHKHIPVSESINRFVQKYHLQVLVGAYVFILVLILQAFWYYWSTLL